MKCPVLVVSVFPKKTNAVYFSTIFVELILLSIFPLKQTFNLLIKPSRK